MKAEQNIRRVLNYRIAEVKKPTTNYGNSLALLKSCKNIYRKEKIARQIKNAVN